MAEGDGAKIAAGVALGLGIAALAIVLAVAFSNRSKTTYTLIDRDSQGRIQAIIERQNGDMVRILGQR